jgi:hypothetical protein
LLYLWFNSPYPHKIFCYRAYFNESPVEVVKEQDKEFNKLATDAIIPSMPGHVVQAFTLLKSSTEAQVCAKACVNILHYSFGEIRYLSPNLVEPPPWRPWAVLQAHWQSAKEIFLCIIEDYYIFFDKYLCTMRVTQAPKRFRLFH